MVKVLLVTNILPPYRIPLYNCLAESESFEFRVVTLAEIEANRRWRLPREVIKFDYVVLKGFHGFLWNRDLPIHIDWGLSRILRHYSPDVVITSGYDCLSYWEAFIYCKVFGKKFLLWNGTTIESVKNPSGAMKLVKQIIVKGADRCIAYGTKAAEYLEYMGARREHIHVGINTVDMDWYSTEVAKVRNCNSFLSWRSNYPDILLLYVGQIIKRKGVDQILISLSRLQDDNVGLIIVGDGPDTDSCKKLRSKHNLQSVYFVGHRQQEELPYYYALADVLVLPSTKEVWGLVINEALAGGLYVLCSRLAGASYDLIKPGWNGMLFNPRNPDEVEYLIRYVRANIQEIRGRRRAIRSHARQNFGIKRYASAFLGAIREAIEI